MMKRKVIKLIFLAVACFGSALVACSRQSSPPPKTLAEFETATAGKDSLEIAKFVLERYECNSCHALDEKGKLGFTEQAQEMAQQFQGCRPLLADINVISQVPDAERTDDERRKAAEFQEYGCVFCHQIVPGQLGLTEIGDKLGFFHAACNEGFCCTDSKP